MSRGTDRRQVSYKYQSDLNDDGNVRNGRNVGNVWNVRNIKTLPDTKCHTFLEPQARTDLNDDGNFMNGGNVRNIRNVRKDTKCHTFSEPQLYCYADLNPFRAARFSGPQPENWLIFMYLFYLFCKFFSLELCRRVKHEQYQYYSLDIC